MTMFTNILAQQCPRCRKGKMFEYGTYNLSKFTKMKESCSRGGQPFELEPSFYVGAMYVSYALQVALFTAVIVAYKVLYPEADMWTYVWSIVVAIVLFMPFIFRISRVVWIHFFVKYDPKVKS